MVLITIRSNCTLGHHHHHHGRHHNQIGSYAGCTGAWLMAGVPGQIACNVATVIYKDHDDNHHIMITMINIMNLNTSKRTRALSLYRRPGRLAVPWILFTASWKAVAWSHFQDCHSHQPGQPQGPGELINWRIKNGLVTPPSHSRHHPLVPSGVKDHIWGCSCSKCQV